MAIRASVKAMTHGARRRRTRVAAFVSGTLAAVGLTAAISAHITATADPAPPAAGEFVPITPSAVVSTTLGIGWSGQIQAGQTKNVTIAGTHGVPATGVLAVVLEVASFNSGSSNTYSGNLWVWPAGSPQPQYAVLANGSASYTADSTVIAQLGTNGQVSFADGTNSAPVDIVANVEGYVTSGTTASAGATFAPLTSTRVIDTLKGLGGRSTPLTAAGGAWTFHLAGLAGIPTSGVSAVALNVGVHGASASCWVQSQPAGATSGSYPRVISYPGYPTQELSVVPMSSTGDIGFTTGCASVDIYVDVEGYYLSSANGSGGDVYVPITNPTRVINTSTNLGITGPMATGRIISGSSAVSVVGGTTQVPATADAVALAVEGLNANTSGNNTIWTDGTTEPVQGVSSINLDPTVPESNLIFVQAGANGKIDLADNSSSATESNDLYVDVEGYFYNLAPQPVPASALCATPADTCNQPADVHSVQPTLAAMTTDAANHALTYNFELYSMNADGSQSLVQSSSTGPAASGQSVTWRTPTPLNNNIDYEYRVRATNGLVYSAWSGWYQFETDAPSVHTLSPAATLYDSTVDPAGPLASGATRIVQVKGVAGISSAAVGGADAVEGTIAVAPIGSSAGQINLSPDQGAGPPITAVTFSAAPATASLNVEIVGNGAIDITNASTGPVNVSISVNEWLSFTQEVNVPADPATADDSTIDPFPQAVDDVSSTDLGPAPSDADVVTADDNPNDIPDGTDAAQVKAALSAPEDPSQSCAAATDGASCTVTSVVPSSQDIANFNANISADAATGDTANPSALNESISTDAATVDAASRDTANGSVVSGLPANFDQCPARTHYYSRVHSCHIVVDCDQWTNDGNLHGTGVLWAEVSTYVSTTNTSIRSVWTWKWEPGGDNADKLNAPCRFPAGSTGVASGPYKDVSVDLSNGTQEHNVAAGTLQFQKYYHENWVSSVSVSNVTRVALSKCEMIISYHVPDPYAGGNYPLGASRFFAPAVRTDDEPYLSNGVGSVLVGSIPTFRINAQGTTKRTGTPYLDAALFVDHGLWNLSQANPGNRQFAGQWLTRTRDSTIINANRNTACPASFPRTAIKNTCDEYPFAVTRQGASVGGPPGAKWDHEAMPGVQNSAIGGLLSGFYRSFRIFDGDRFWVEVYNIPLACGTRCQ